MSANHTVYTPIKPYQTRIICLDGHGGDPSSTISCELHVVDILHHTFGGLGIRAHSLDGERTVPYKALSYTWGDPKHTNVIACNQTGFGIAANLYDALHALRSVEDSYIWIDAICINQDDEAEKAVQIMNMLVIFHEATVVIAWLGPVIDHLETIAELADCVELVSGSSSYSYLDIARFCHGLRILYSLPWFRRIWIQQEIFAARKIRFLYGTLEFAWHSLLCRPELLLDVPHLEGARRALSKKDVDCAISFFRRRDERAFQRAYNSTLDALFSETQRQVRDIFATDVCAIQHLSCIRYFSECKSKKLDFVETLLQARNLNASDCRDHIYGLVGMTNFPAKPMSVSEWGRSDKNEVFIPIDYTKSNTTSSLLSVVTLALLMKAGLAIVAKFKACPISDDDEMDCSMPSWTVDWTLATKLFSQRDIMSFICATDVAGYDFSDDVNNPTSFNNAWHRLVGLGLWRRNAPSPRKLVPWTIPSGHNQFCQDNQSFSITDNKLFLRGFIDSRFYIKHSSIWQKQDIWQKPQLTRDLLMTSRFRDTLVWKLDIDLYPSDMIVQMLAFAGSSYQGVYTQTDDDTKKYENGGLWLLRPQNFGGHKMIACLSWVPTDLRLLYSDWIWNPEGAKKSFGEHDSSPRFRRFSIDPEVLLRKYELNPDDHKDEIQMFTII